MSSIKVKPIDEPNTSSNNKENTNKQEYKDNSPSSNEVKSSIITFSNSESKEEIIVEDKTEDSPPNIQLNPTNSKINVANFDEKKLVKSNAQKKQSKKKLSCEKLNESSDEDSNIKNTNQSPSKVSEKEFDPTKKNYHPIKDAFWDHGQS